MWFEIFFRGIIIGIVATIPSLGPVGVLCIQRTLSKNHKSGFFSGVGAAAADALFASAAFFSLALVTNFIIGHSAILRGIGGLFIIVLGMYIFFRNPIVQIRRNRSGKSNLWQDFISTFLITLANPMYILVFVALFTTFGMSNNMGEFNGWTMIIGVFIGATTWWFVLTSLVSLFRKKIRPRHLLWMNRIAGALIAILGLVTILSTVINFHMNVLR